MGWGLRLKIVGFKDKGKSANYCEDFSLNSLLLISPLTSRIEQRLFKYKPFFLAMLGGCQVAYMMLV